MPLSVCHCFIVFNTFYIVYLKIYNIYNIGRLLGRIKKIKAKIIPAWAWGLN